VAIFKGNPDPPWVRNQGSAVLNLILLSLSVTKSYAPLAFFLVLLLGATVFVPPASGEPPVWRTSADLIKKSPKSFPRLDKAGIEAVIKRLPKSVTLIKDYLLDKDAAVFSHKGDLTIDGSFDNAHTLIVDGNLTIRGSYDDYRDGIGILLVLGDMRAEHIVSWGSIAVTGTLESTGLVYAYYNDFTFEVGGPVKARALVVFDKAANYPRVDAAVVQSEGGERAALAVRHFAPELMIEDLLDKEDPDASGIFATASYDAARKRIEAGLPIFRDQVGPESLASDIRKLVAPRVDGTTMARLAKTDRLLAMIAATRPSVPVDEQQQLAATGDAAILELLAANPKADRGVLAKIAKTNASIASSVAKNPNAPAEATSALAASSDPAVRIALLEKPSLPAADLSRLATDKDASVRKRLVESRHLRSVSTSDLAKLIADPQIDVRAALPRHDGVLSIEQFAILARDKSPIVRQAAAQALSEQQLWRQMPMGAAEARAALIATLLKDAEKGVRFAAVIGASSADQEQFVASQPAGDRARADMGLAEVTRSAAIMARVAEGEQAGAEELAKNLAITPALQLRLIAKLPDPTKRPRISIVDFEALSKQAQSWDAVIDQLAQNPNATPEALLAIARYCRASTGRPFFCATLMHRRDLTAEMFDTLDGASDLDDWGLTVLLSHYPTRAQVERAVPRWHNDEPELLAAFKKLKSQTGAAWWDALASSKLPKLREIAAANAATPAATLVKLLRDPENDVKGPAAANPSTPIDALNTVPIDGLSWVLANPRVPDSLIRSRLDQALRDDDSCKKVLAARTLRAAS
jgi:hypothetical protein